MCKKSTILGVYAKDNHNPFLCICYKSQVDVGVLGAKLQILKNVGCQNPILPYFTV